MSVQINCDRCERNTRGYFVGAWLEVNKGSAADTSSRFSGNGLPWRRNWHLCETCFNDLEAWAAMPDKTWRDTRPECA